MMQTFTLMVMWLGALVALPSAAVAQDARAAAVLADARTALGGEAKLNAVTTLQASGPYRRTMGDAQIEGELEILIAGRDKFRRNEEMGMPQGPTLLRAEVLNGEEVWEDQSNRGGGGGMVVMRMGPAGENDPERMRQMQRRQRRAELSRLLLAWLLTTDAPATHAGVAEAPDGKADVIEFTPAEGPAVRLFVDQQSKLPLMITWQAPAPQMMVRRGVRREGPESQPDPQGPPSGPPPQATFEMRLDDYREANGIKLPHLITRHVDGKPVEEWTIGSYKLNAPLKANTFAK